MTLRLDYTQPVHSVSRERAAQLFRQMREELRRRFAEIILALGGWA
jgi:hypothetical protein